MGFVDEEHSLEARVIATFDHDWRVIFLELLDIYDDDFRLALRVVDRLVVPDLLHQVLAALDGLNHEAAGGELVN